MRRPCRIGLQLPEVEWEVSWPELIFMARTAEAIGFDSLWVGDHLLYDLPKVGPRGPWEAWTSLAALAAVTERVLLGPLVASIGFHAPAMLAKQAATVDAISGGRLVLGLGAGWNEREYRAFGFPFDHRVSRFEEAVTIVRSLLRDGRLGFSGTYFELEDCVLHPRPDRPGGPPLLVGSTGPRVLRAALPHVDAWNAWWSDFDNDPKTYRRLLERMWSIAAEVGRDPADITPTAAVYVQLAGGAGRRMGDHGASERAQPLRGSAGELAEQLAAFADAGAAHLQLVVDPITRTSIEDLAGVLELLDGR